jgi:integrase
MKSRVNPTTSHITIRDLAELYGKHAINPSFSITRPERDLQVPAGYLRHKARVLFHLVDLAGNLSALSMPPAPDTAFLKYLGQVHGAKSPATVLKKANTARAVFVFGFKHGYCGVWRTPPSDTDITKLIETARQEDPLVALGLGLSRYAGLRTSEVLRLPRNQIDVDHAAIKVVGNKLVTKGANRVISMTSELVELLRAVPFGKPDEPVIPLTRAEYRRRVEAVRIAAGVPPLHQDALRVAYCCHVAWDGLEMAKRQAALGH